jgi:lipoprotein NlpD
MHSSLLSALSNPKFRCAAALIAVALVAAGCASRRPAPVEDRTAAQPPPIASVPQPAPPAAGAPSAPVPTYTVKRGDTLHQIALDSGLDYRELAAWNNIENANVIRVGQVLARGTGTTADPNASVTAQEVARVSRRRRCVHRRPSLPPRRHRGRNRRCRRVGAHLRRMRRT